MWTYAAVGFGMDGTRTAWAYGPHLMPFPWMTYSNPSQPGKKCRRSWQKLTRVLVSMCWAHSTTP